MRVNLPEIEPGLEGTWIGKVRLLMRSLGLTDISPAQFNTRVESAGLDIVHARSVTEALPGDKKTL